MVGLILVYLTFSLPLSTWLLQGYFRGVPRELEEQGMIDGHSRLGALIHIVLPLSAPGIAAVSIFTFTGAWNELLLALVLITSESQRTAPLALNYLITSDELPWGPLMAGAVVSVGAADDPLFRRPAFHGAGHDRRLGEGMTFKDRNNEMSIRIAVGQFHDLTEERLRFAAQIGATGLQMNNPDASGRNALGGKGRARAGRQDRGIRAEVRGDRERPDALLQQGDAGAARAATSRSRTTGIRSAPSARAGVPVLGYHFMPNSVWTTDRAAPTRGGAGRAQVRHGGGRCGGPRCRGS